MSIFIVITLLQTETLKKNWDVIPDTTTMHRGWADLSKQQSINTNLVFHFETVLRVQITN